MSLAVQVTDAGLQPERTSLSFVRTGLAILALATASLRYLPANGPVVLACPLAAAVLVMAAALREWRSRPARRTQFAADHVVPATIAGALLTASVVLVGLGGLWSLLR